MAGVRDGDAHAGAAVHVGLFVRADEQTAAHAHGVDGVGDEVVEHLAYIIFKAEDVRVGGVAGLDLDAGVGQPARVEPHDGAHQVGCRDARWVDGLAVETQGLSGDLRDAREF